MKKKGKVAIAVMLIVALFASMAFVSAVSTHEHGIDDEKSYDIDNLSQDLEDAVTSYNEAVTKWRLDDVLSRENRPDCSGTGSIWHGSGVHNDTRKSRNNTDDRICKC